MKRSMTMATVVTAVLTLTSSLVLAQPRWGGGGPGRGQGKGPGHRGMMGQQMGQMLELTDSQRQQVWVLRDQMRKSTADTRSALQAKHEEMRVLWLQDVPNRAAILAKHAEIDALRATMREAHIDFRLAVHALLTPEQRAKLAELPPPGKHGGHGPGGGMGGPGGGFGPGGPWDEGGEEF
jgi:Spy/CpxP family protein refolding chaperone